MRTVALVTLVAAGVMFFGLGAAPFVDPPDGFHAEIAREMAATGDWITPRLDTVRYFDKPPLPYWLMSASFAVAGVGPGAARFWGALGGVGIAAATALLGVWLGGPRLGLLAGLFAAGNLGIYLFGRIVKPDLLFVFFITLAWVGLAVAIRGRRGGLALFYGALGVAAITKDPLGAIAPLLVLAAALWWRGECVRWFFPWWGVTILLVVALPWYLVVEARNGGVLWYTVVDNHLLNVIRRRAFPDEDVPLGALEFVAVTAAAFLPWALATPAGAVRALRDDGPAGRLWRVLALWAGTVVVAFTISPFKLPHYGLPAFPALALLAARAWDDACRDPGRSRRVLVPALALFAILAAAFAVASAGLLPVGDSLATVDVQTRNLAARGQSAAAAPLAAWRPIIVASGVLFAAATSALAVAAWRRTPRLGAAAAVVAMLGFLPVAGEGMATFARTRDAGPVARALVARATPGDLVVHEGALENSGSVLLALGRPVPVVNGLRSNLAFGATFPDSRDLFWDEARFVRAWSADGGGRRFLVSVVAPDRSVVRRLPPDRVHLVARSGAHWLYADVADPGGGRP